MNANREKCTGFGPKLLTADFDAGIVDMASRILRGHDHFRYHLNSLSLEHKNGRLIITGRLPSFYLKQLLQTVLGTMPEVESIENQVNVVSCQGLSSVPHFQERRAKL